MFIFAFLSNNYQVYHLIRYFVTFVGLFFIVILVMIHINNRKQEKINIDLDNEE